MKGVRSRTIFHLAFVCCVELTVGLDVTIQNPQSGRYSCGPRSIGDLFSLLLLFKIIAALFEIIDIAREKKFPSPENKHHSDLARVHLPNKHHQTQLSTTKSL